MKELLGGWGRAVLVLVVAVAVFTGCSDHKQNALAPAAPAMVAAHAGDPTGEDAINVTWTRIDATHMLKTYYVRRTDFHGVSVIVGPIKVLYYLDYPAGFMGPLPPGHCREDGTGCN